MPRHDPTAAHPTPTTSSRKARPLPRPSPTGAGLALSSPRWTCVHRERPVYDGTEVQEGGGAPPGRRPQ
eukprot:6767614-Prymnesium_polylepis.1